MPPQSYRSSSGKNRNRLGLGFGVVVGAATKSWWAREVAVARETRRRTDDVNGNGEHWNWVVQHMLSLAERTATTMKCVSTKDIDTYEYVTLRQTIGNLRHIMYCNMCI